MVRSGAFLVRAGSLDRALFARVARGRGPGLDRTLPRLSVAANHAFLWVGASAVLGVFGGSAGRRAAARGMGSVVVTSALVNLAVKRVVRRPRPGLWGVPAARRLRVQPLTTSFPSGHAASAAAFAVGAGVEAPRVGAALAPVAAAVAYSRIYVGVHYPGDVAAGAAIGAAVAALGRRVTVGVGRGIVALS